MTKHLRNACKRAAPALMTALMLLWLIVGAAITVAAGDFPRGF